MNRIRKFFRMLFNSKSVTKKDYRNSDELVKQKLQDLKNKLNG